MNALGKPYRAQFLGGPQDGCHVEAEVPLGKKVATSGRPWDRSASGASGPAVGSVSTIGSVGVVGSGGNSQRDHLAEYWLERAEYCVENELPQVVFHYKFHALQNCLQGSNTTGAARQSDGCWRRQVRGWFGCQAVRLGRWLQTPVDYPLDVRRVGR